MSYLPRADDFVPRPGYDYTPVGPEDFIFNHNTTNSLSPTEDNLSDTPPLSENLKKYRFYFGIYLPCNHSHTVDPLSNTAVACLTPAPFTMSFHHHACITHHKKLILYFTSKDNKIPDVSISFTTTYRAYNSNIVAKKGLDFIYGKVYRNFRRTPSSSTKVRKRQEARFDASIRHTFHNANLQIDAPMDDKLRAAQHHMLLFQENQQFSKPIKHLRYKKKFIIPKQDDYTFLLPFPETNTIPIVATSDFSHIDSSVVSPPFGNSTPPPSVIDIFENVPLHYILLIPEEPFYEGGLHNQPSRNRIRKHNLKPLTVGSHAWLAHMKEIYDIHIEDTKYELDKIDAGI
ncbi:uncharacterized protein OCT59_016048 [Rhizophagus irregularis]|nr:hypothetical protein OCT59_016048 [Rhizophagus irregularis]